MKLGGSFDRSVEPTIGIFWGLSGGVLYGCVKKYYRNHSTTLVVWQTDSYSKATYADKMWRQLSRFAVH